MVNVFPCFYSITMGVIMNSLNQQCWNVGLEGSCLQIASLDHTPIRVMAGPGTGKTFALMKRVTRLLQSGIDQSKILVCTFTRTAAKDLSDEIERMGISDASKIDSGTLHSLCFKILTSEEVFTHTNRTIRPLLAFEERFLMEDIAGGIFGGVRDVNNRLNAFDAAWARLQSDQPGWPTSEIDKAFHLKLLEWLKFHECILIGELVPETLNYLRDNPYSPYLSKYEHVLVDEYQDLNKAEQELLDLLSLKGNLVIIGDVNQSIYSFRHAHPEGVAEFHNTHPGTHDEELVYCRRCPASIVDMAKSLIENNSIRSDKDLKHHPGNDRGENYIVQWYNMEAEAQGLATFISECITNRNINPGRILVLSTRRCFGVGIRDCLVNMGIGAQSFFHEELLDGNAKINEKSLTQQAFSILTLLAKPDDIVALRCWCGFGSSNLRSSSWEHLKKYCIEKNMTPWSALSDVTEGNLKIPYAGHLVERFQDLISEFNRVKNLKGQDLVDALFPIDQDYNVRFHDIAAKISDQDYNASTFRNELIRAITQPELPTDVDYVRIMSLHKSKGLTADVVLVVGCMEGLLPCLKESNLEAESRAIEEQRRLLYVAITRAKQILLLSSVALLPRSIAHVIGAKLHGGDSCDGYTFASRFLTQLGVERPKSIEGEDLFDSMHQVSGRS